MSTSWITYAVVAISAFALTAPIVARGDGTSGDGSSQSELPADAQPLAGAGAWASARDGQGARNWQVRIEKFSDDSIQGRIFVVGSAAVQEARI